MNRLATDKRTAVISTLVALEQVQSGLGSVWTWKAIDADTKLVISYTIGDRGADTAKAFMQDVASRISNRIQLTTDGHRVYADAVEDAFGSDIAAHAEIANVGIVIRNSGHAASCVNGRGEVPNFVGLRCWLKSTAHRMRIQNRAIAQQPASDAALGFSLEIPIPTTSQRHS